MDFTSTFVMKQYAEMEKDNEESSDSSEEEESEEEDEDAMEKEDVDFDEEKLNLASAETQYINAMVAKIILESEKNHPERNSKNVWEMLYGDMETYDATSSEDEKKKGHDTSSDDDDDDDDDDSEGHNSAEEVHSSKITWEDKEEDDVLMDLKSTLSDFIKDPEEQEWERKLAESKRKKKVKVTKMKELKADNEEDAQLEGNKVVAPDDEVVEEVEIEVEETPEEEEERLKLENHERIVRERELAHQKWIVLHSWMVEFRLKHNMTILDFLEYAGAEREMISSWQVKQYLSRTAHKYNPSESHTTWGGRTRRLIRETKSNAEGGEITHKQYMQLRLLHYRGEEYSPDDELHYTLRLGYESPVEEETTIVSFDDIESLAPLEPTAEEMNEQLEKSRMAEEDENYLDQKYDPVVEVDSVMRSTFQYESGSEISDSDISYGDTDSSSGDEFDWEGGREGHNMRKEQRKIIREDINVLNEIFDTLEEKQKKEEEKERQEREAKEAEEREPTDVAGKVAWRLKRFERAKAIQDAEEEARRIEASVKEREEKERRKMIRKKNKARKEKAMTMLRALRPETLFV